MIIQAEYQWEVIKEGEAYTASLIAGKPFIFRFARGLRTPAIGCRVNVDDEVWTGECVERPEAIPDGMNAAEVANLYARVARDAGDALAETIKREKYGYQ